MVSQLPLLLLSRSPLRAICRLVLCGEGFAMTLLGDISWHRYGGHEQGSVLRTRFGDPSNVRYLSKNCGDEKPHMIG